jgi:hypothetical protein
MRKQREPNFFIVGAAKAATTSLASYLGQHPDIFLSAIKEPFYFVTDIGAKSYGSYEEYLSLFQKAGKARVVGEASTGYLFDQDAPSLIERNFPGARFLIMLRNPADMAFSLWRYMTSTGNETKKFEEAISVEERKYRRTAQFSGSCAGWWANYLYLERASYHEQVKRYIDIFGRNRIRIHIFENFIENPEQCCQEIFAFLGVDDHFVPDCRRIINASGGVRSQLLKDLRHRKYPLIQKLVPKRHRMRIRGFARQINIKKEAKMAMDSETRRTLTRFFREDIASLERLLGFEVLQWRNNDDAPVDTDGADSMVNEGVKEDAVRLR